MNVLQLHVLCCRLEEKANHIMNIVQLREKDDR